MAPAEALSIGSCSLETCAFILPQAASACSPPSLRDPESMIQRGKGGFSYDSWKARNLNLSLYKHGSRLAIMVTEAHTGAHAK